MSKLMSPYLSDVVARRIYMIREQRVMLDSDLASLYGVSTKGLNQAVRRNARRFPWDFMFQLTKDESKNWRSQNVPSKKGSLRSQNVTLKRGQHLKYQPYAFTEQGVAMLSSVLNSKRAIRVNIQIMRAFVSIRRVEGSHRDLLLKIEQMEKKYDAQFQIVFKALKALLEDRSKDQGKRFEV